MILQIHIIKFSLLSMISETFAEFIEFLKLLRILRIRSDWDRYLWQWNASLFKWLLSDQFRFFWVYFYFRVNFVFGEIGVFVYVQVIYLDYIRNIRKIGVYSQGSNFGRTISTWWYVRVRLEMACSLSFLGLVHLVHRYSESGSFLTNYMFLSQGWQVGRTCLAQAILVDQTCLSRYDLLGLDARVPIGDCSGILH